MGPRRTSGWIAVAALVVAGTATATTGGAVSASGSATPPEQAAKADPGTWRVQGLGDGRYVVSWTSPTAFPLTSDRPTIVGSADLVIGAPTIQSDGRTVRADVTSATRPQPADLDVVLSGDRLDDAGDDRLRSTSGAFARDLELPGTVTLPVDPGTPGPFDVTTSDYSLDPVKLPGMPEPIEMVGHVVVPAADEATGSRPLVLFLHGRHSVCYDPDDPRAGDGAWPCRPPMQEIPSHLGYDYAQRVLASQGYATVSVRVNGINGQDYRLPDGGADARAEIVEHHLDHWTGLAAEHGLDLDRVVLVGHSRGGEGVDRASIQIQLSAPYRIAGQVLIAPTNFGVQTAAYVPTVTLLPNCDGDVSDLQGQKFTDAARDLAPDDTSLRSSVLVLGANHNYFNTEWTPGIARAPSWDDWGGDPKSICSPKHADRLSPEEQQAVGTAYVAGAVHLFADDEQGVLPMFDGTRARVASTGGAQVLSHAIGGGRDVRAPALAAERALPVGATTRFCRSAAAPERVASCGHGLDYGWVWPHWTAPWENSPTRAFFEMRWTGAGQSGGLRLDEPLDLSAGRLEVRTIVDPAGGPQDLGVRVTDADGGSALLTPVGGALPPIDGGFETAKYWAQTLVADPSGTTGVDLTRIVRVDLVAGTERGRLWVADLAVAPAALVPVPDVRLATVDIGTVRVEEGDGRGPVTVSVPFDVVGEVTRPARLAVLTAGQGIGDVQRFTVDIAPGQTSGSIPVTYAPDRRDDFDRSITLVVAWATRNVMTDRYAGGLTVLDDDPAPRLRVEPVERTVEEGEPARWRVRLDKPVDYDQFFNVTIVRGPAPRLAAGDVRASWLERMLRRFNPDKPLWSYRSMMFERLRPGQRDVVVSVPTRRDGAAEGRESVTIKLQADRRHYKRTVYVAPSP